MAHLLDILINKFLYTQFMLYYLLFTMLKIQVIYMKI